MYLKMVKGDDDPVYSKLHEKFCKLANKDVIKQKTNKVGVTYVETTNLLDFEKKNTTSIVIEKSENGKRYAYFILDGIKQLATVNKSLSTEEEKAKEKLAISSCRDKNSKAFWLIHKSEKVTVPSPPKVDVDELNKELDLLLNS
jgi:hypothetical protein